MCEITEKNILEMANVISYRNKIEKQQIFLIIKEINRISDENGVSVCGPVVISFYSYECTPEKILTDAEIMVPVTGAAVVPDGYTFKPLFRLNDAVKLRFTGSLTSIASERKKILRYMSDNHITPASAVYYAVLEWENDDDMTVDLYIGASYNML